MGLATTHTGLIEPSNYQGGSGTRVVQPVQTVQHPNLAKGFGSHSQLRPDNDTALQTETASVFDDSRPTLLSLLSRNCRFGSPRHALRAFLAAIPVSTTAASSQLLEDFLGRLLFLFLLIVLFLSIFVRYQKRKEDFSGKELMNERQGT